MRYYRDDDICQVYKIVGSGRANVHVGWFDSDDPNNPAFTTNFGGFSGFGISPTTVAAGISYHFNLEADRGKTKNKYHFDSEGPFLIVRRNSDEDVDPLDCVNTRVAIISGGVDDGQYSLLPIPIVSTGIWDLETDPDIGYLEGPLIDVARGSIITTTTSPAGPLQMELADREIGDEFFILNSTESTDIIEIQLDMSALPGNQFERIVPLLPGKTAHFIWDGFAWTLDGEMTLRGRYLPIDSLPFTLTAGDMNSAPGTVVDDSGTLTLDITGPFKLGQRFTILSLSGSVTAGSATVSTGKYVDLVWNGSDWEEEV